MIASAESVLKRLEQQTSLEPHTLLRSSTGVPEVESGDPPITCSNNSTLAITLSTSDPRKRVDRTVSREVIQNCREGEICAVPTDRIRPGRSVQ